MSWRQEAMKDVVGCDKPGVGVKQPLIPGSLNYLHPNVYGVKANAGN